MNVEISPLPTLYCQLPEQLFIKMGSDDSHFNVLLIVRGNVTRLSTNHNFWKEGRAEEESNQSSSAYQPNALLLGRTGSLL